MGIGSFKALTFDGLVSTDYGVYITGEGVYNAPQRAAEVVAIPGRNGAFIQDLGRFDNIQVTYTAGVFGTDQANFAAKVDAFRNALASRYGYCRLEDEYHADEYREAAFLGGLEVEPAGRSNAGEFSITFECKPQRFLKTGETAVTVTSGDTLTNPTAFDAQPLLEVEGYGSITLNGQTITIVNDPMGWVSLAPDVDPWSQAATESGRGKVFPIDTAALATGDTITAIPGGSGFGLRYLVGGIFSPGYVAAGEQFKSQDGLTTLNFVKGTADTNYIVHNNLAYSSYKTADGTTHNGVIAYRIDATYNGDDTITVTPTFLSSTVEGVTGARFYLGYGTLMGNSTLSTTGQPLYIDLAIGEAYKENAGEYINVNANAIIGVELPTLAPGGNVITYDNTITSLDIIPRWWTV